MITPPCPQVVVQEVAAGAERRDGAEFGGGPDRAGHPDPGPGGGHQLALAQPDPRGKLPAGARRPGLLRAAGTARGRGLPGRLPNVRGRADGLWEIRQTLGQGLRVLAKSAEPMTKSPKNFTKKDGKISL